LETPLKPILLLADSQLLFWRSEQGLFLDRVRSLMETERPKAAYLGASNGDQPEFFELFQGAMASIGVEDCLMVPSKPKKSDLAFFEAADLILLAGGEPIRGWRAFESVGLQKRILERYYGGALLMGVSAGAVQLGLYGASNDTDGAGDLNLFETLKLVPYLVDAHAEPDWLGLANALPMAGQHVRGLGIPSGGGAFIHPDLTVEPVRTPLTELTLLGETVSRALLFPPGSRDEDASPSESPPGLSPEPSPSSTVH